MPRIPSLAIKTNDSCCPRTGHARDDAADLLRGRGSLRARRHAEGHLVAWFGPCLGAALPPLPRPNTGRVGVGAYDTADSKVEALNLGPASAHSKS